MTIKKIIIIIIILGLIVLGGVLFMNKNQKDLIINSELIAESIINTYKDVDIYTNNSDISDDLKLKISEYHNMLRSKNNYYYEINTSIIIDDSFEDLPPPEDIELNETDIIDEETVEKKDTKGIIEKENNVIAIKVNDIKFSDIGYAEVVYNGIPYSIYIQDVPETFDMMQNNPDYLYKYQKTIEDEKEIRVYYKSIATNFTTCIRVKNDGFKVINFTVE